LDSISSILWPFLIAFFLVFHRCCTASAHLPLLAGISSNLPPELWKSLVLADDWTREDEPPAKSKTKSTKDKPKNVMTRMSPLLHIAAAEEKIAVAEFLLKAGAKPNALHLSPASGYIYSALHVAVLAQRVESVKLLLKAGADVNLGGGNETAADTSSLCFAAELSSFEIVRLLCEEGKADFKPNPALPNPVHYACQVGNFETVKYFISKGVSYVNNSSKS